MLPSSGIPAGPLEPPGGSPGLPGGSLAPRPLTVTVGANVLVNDPTADGADQRALPDISSGMSL